jgi:hypothetical protein
MVDCKDYLKFKCWINLLKYSSDKNWQFKKIVKIALGFSNNSLDKNIITYALKT